ncbi:transcriptional regulator, Crp/Fnr family [Pediococcus damnosus]|uniref:Transcriptional regulator, Crp/Fnr family n=1 Tax=Pediococcus damnosus TaxID=51663 RepID=A0A0R2HR14_9LACO|nr:Crp/Fnr family transcriptional regulator [Pediococcus damnosus]AMV60312.1 transcriptional regulator, Crp/Fnr family [Pediococcus damnosus]AMV62841.1 transcriptional regulator, Crp/Fnr family [Pediococcus damnosus]AMV64561.1 transcriptional regulator, Crp/Fnr family [Pediococcus damnosus]AMV67274.1 transcriptional regulator, Crp/Fnr family [Pediococcus damnosus]KJU74650.1 Crp/Fnr family transcriptional regulator [Pediococcus damnosus LMG 28219]
MQKSEHDCIKLVPLFDHLPDEDVDKIEAIITHKHYAAGESLFLDGDDLDTLMIVANGQVKVSKIAANGREQLLYLLQTGDFDGEGALFQDKTHTSSAVALIPTAVCQISRKNFQKLLSQSPSISMNLINEFGQRISSLEKRTTEAATESVEARIGSYLVETGASLDKDTFKLPIKKKDLAIYLGTTPETVSRKLTDFESKGWISQGPQKQIKLLDKDALVLLD